MKITVFTPDWKRTWRANLSRTQIARLDNGHLVSIGLEVGKDIKQRTVDGWVKSGKAIEENPDKAKHSGCQSKCILKGDLKCQW
jgi:hypothetical protein